MRIVERSEFMGNDENGKRNMEKVKKLIKHKAAYRVLLIIVVILVAFGVYSYVDGMRNQKEIITVSFLNKIINISDLNTYQAVYNGVAEVMSEEKEDEIDFYVSYEAKVNAGFDFEKVEFVNDIETKRIIITIPKIEIGDIHVDIGSLDYIYLNKVSDDEMITKIAYKACLEDVERESKNEKQIIELAEQNAVNIVEALISPFVQQYDPEYEILIRGEL
jgi:hypothetical protein